MNLRSFDLAPPREIRRKGDHLLHPFTLAISVTEVAVCITELAVSVVQNFWAEPGARQPFIQFTSYGHDGRSGPSMRTAYRQAKRGFPSLYGAHTAPKILGDFFPATEEPLLLSEQSRFFHLISECRIQSRPVSLGLFYSACFTRQLKKS